MSDLQKSATNAYTETTELKSSYTSRICGLTKNNSTIGKFAHVTCTFFGEQTKEIIQVYWNLITEKITNKIKFKVIDEALFGPDKNIDVYTLEMLDKQLEEYINWLHQEFGVPDHGIFTKTICWHISKRNLSVALEIGDVIEGSKIDVKCLGPHDPILSKVL